MDYAESIGIPREEVENYGRYIAKIPEQLIDEEKVKKCISPTRCSSLHTEARTERRLAQSDNRLLSDFVQSQGTSAHNMISALLDNYLYQNQAKGFGLKEILWRRV